MSQHTPGPWKVNSFSGEVNTIGLTEVYANNPEWFINGGASPIVSVARISITNQESNARLIAHAPAMQDLLAKIAAEICDHWPMPFCPRKEARALLRQIEGQP